MSQIRCWNASAFALVCLPLPVGADGIVRSRDVRSALRSAGLIECTRLRESVQTGGLERVSVAATLRQGDTLTLPAGWTVRGAVPRERLQHVVRGELRSLTASIDAAVHHYAALGSDVSDAERKASRDDAYRLLREMGESIEGLVPAGQFGCLMVPPAWLMTLLPSAFRAKPSAGGSRYRGPGITAPAVSLLDASDLIIEPAGSVSEPSDGQSPEVVFGEASVDLLNA